MTHPTHELDNLSLSLPITQTALRTAQQFANEQPTPQKAEQVRFNTLAVCVVNDYLQMMGIPTNLKASDSWNPVLRLCANVADLEVTGVGRVECRPHQNSQPNCYIPPEVWLDRVGYVVVEIDELSLEATVLGFTQNVAREELPIRQLQPIEDLIDCLVEPQPVIQPKKAKINLSQWLFNTFERGWETVETLLAPAESDLAFSFRSAPDSVMAEPELYKEYISRAKLIDLGMQLAGYPVALVVELQPESDRKTNILLQVHPIGDQLYLPPLLQLTVLDESGLIFLEAQARNADNYIQLQFSGVPGEQFSVKVALGDASVIEDFVL
ncbi:DUF1822 family protein [Allocoleopsis sp.]|uniref:DUF1822 family protein n=1 Tax=Allocoleopsis sp. TaxID=3088169 RepID=UPI002FD2AD2E